MTTVWACTINASQHNILHLYTKPPRPIYTDINSNAATLCDGVYASFINDDLKCQLYARKIYSSRLLSDKNAVIVQTSLVEFVEYIPRNMHTFWFSLCGLVPHTQVCLCSMNVVLLFCFISLLTLVWIISEYMHCKWPQGTFKNFEAVIDSIYITIRFIEGLHQHFWMKFY